MIRGRSSLWPSLRVKILVHDEFREAEEVETDVGGNRPVFDRRNGTSDVFEESIHARLFVGHFETGHRHTLFGELRLERDVGKDVLAAPVELGVRTALA